MLKKIIRVLTITLTIMIQALVCKLLENIKIKKEIREANIVFNESNEKYINKDEETGRIEYKSDTLDINIIPIKKTNPNIEMWEINIKINDASKIKSDFAGDEFSLSKKEKTSNIAMRHNAILAINGAESGFNERSYVIKDGEVIWQWDSINYP